MKWNNLSMKEKAECIKLSIKNNITNLDTIKNIYNKLSEGGFTDNTVVNSNKEKEWLSNYYSSRQDKFDLFNNVAMNDTYLYPNNSVNISAMGGSIGTNSNDEYLKIHHPKIYESQRARAKYAAEIRAKEKAKYEALLKKEKERQIKIDRERDLIMNSLEKSSLGMSRDPQIGAKIKKAANKHHQEVLNTWEPALNAIDLSMNTWQLFSGNPTGFALGVLTNGIQLGNSISTGKPITKDVISLGMDGVGLLGSFNVLKPISFRRGHTTYRINTDRVSDVAGKGYSVFDSANDIYDIGKAINYYNKSNPELIFKPFSK